MPEFECPDPITVEVSIASGSVRITAEERDSALAEVTPYGDSVGSLAAAEATEVILDGDRLIIEAPQNSRRWFQGEHRIKVDVRVPTDSAARVRVASASVNCRGRYSDVNVNTASGGIDIDEVTGDVKVKTASGNARIEFVGGQLTVHSASGDVAAPKVGGTINAKSASGDIEIGDAGSDVRANTASGDLRVETAHRGTVSSKTASGSVTVGVATGTGVWLDLDTVSGSIHNGLDTTGAEPESRDLTVQIRTVSGDIDVTRSHAAAPA